MSMTQQQVRRLYAYIATNANTNVQDRNLAEANRQFQRLKRTATSLFNCAERLLAKPKLNSRASRYLAEHYPQEAVQDIYQISARLRESFARLALADGRPEVITFDPRTVFTGLIALNEQFDPAYEPRTRQITITTDAITLIDDNGLAHALGRFNVVLSVQAHTITYAIDALEPHYAARFGQACPHPHVQDRHLCAGQSAINVENLANAFDILNLVDMIFATLHSYQSDSAYATLEMWNSIGKCLICGSWANTSYCETCEAVTCREHLMECPGCHEHYCGHCAKHCHHCGKSICPQCSYHATDCPACHRRVCNDCLIRCNHVDTSGKRCTTKTCRRCQTQCDCGKHYCSAHAMRCTRCATRSGLTTLLCPHCAKKCNTCGQALCSSHAFTCYDCGHSFCQDHLSTNGMHCPACLTKRQNTAADHLAAVAEQKRIDRNARARGRRAAKKLATLMATDIAASPIY
jgi:hypothetical protein